MHTAAPQHEPDNALPPPADNRASLLYSLREALSGMRFGQVVVFVEDSQVIRIERLRKRRILSRRRPGQHCSGRSSR